MSFREPHDSAAIGAAIYAALPDMEPRTRHLIEHLLRMLGDRDRAIEDFLVSGIGSPDSFIDDGNVAGAVNVDFSVAKVHKVTLTGAVTFTPTGASTGLACPLTIYAVQDATGGRGISWPASVKFPQGVLPVPSTTPNAIDIFVLESIDGGTTWFGNQAGRGYA